MPSQNSRRLGDAAQGRPPQIRPRGVLRSNGEVAGSASFPRKSCARQGTPGPKLLSELGLRRNCSTWNISSSAYRGRVSTRIPMGTLLQATEKIRLSCNCSTWNIFRCTTKPPFPEKRKLAGDRRGKTSHRPGLRVKLQCRRMSSYSLLSHAFRRRGIGDWRAFSPQSWKRIGAPPPARAVVESYLITC